MKRLSIILQVESPVTGGRASDGVTFRAGWAAAGWLVIGWNGGGGLAGSWASCSVGRPVARSRASLTALMPPAASKWLWGAGGRSWALIRLAIFSLNEDKWAGAKGPSESSASCSMTSGERSVEECGRLMAGSDERAIGRMLEVAAPGTGINSPNGVPIVG